MARLYVGGRLFDGEKVLDGHAVLEEGGKVRKVAPTGRVRGLCRRQGRHLRRHADPRHHRLPCPFAERRRGQPGRGAGSPERRPAHGARHGVHARHPRRRRHRGARLRRQGLHRVRDPRRLQPGPLPRTDHALRRPHDLHDRRPRQPHRPHRRRCRRGREGGARAGPCRLRPGQDHGDRRRDDGRRQSRGRPLLGRGDEGRHQRGAPLPQVLRQPCPGRARHPERGARRHRFDRARHLHDRRVRRRR